MDRLSRYISGRGLQIIVIALMVLLVLLPFWSLLWTSVSGHGVTLSAYIRLFKEHDFSTITQNTLIMSGGAAAVSTVLGVVSALLAVRLPKRHTRYFHVFNVLPLLIPSYISSIAWENMFGPVGFVNHIASHFTPDHTPLVHFFGMGGLIFSLGVVHYPFVYLLTYNALTHVSLSVLRSARISGASGWSIYTRIILPLIRAAALNGALLAFITNVDDFGIAAFIGIPAHITVFSTQIYQLIVGYGTSSFTTAAAWSMLASSVAVLVMGFEYLIQKRDLNYVSGQQDGLRSPVMTPGIWIATTLFGAFFLMVAVVPAALLVMTALSPAIGAPLSFHTMTLENFKSVLGMGQTISVLRTSGELALLTGVGGIVLATVLMFTFRRRQSWLGKTIQSVLTMPYALPGMIYGLAMILAFLKPLPIVHWSLYGTFWILALAYLARFLTLAVRTLTPAFSTFNFSLFNSAIVAGASPFKAIVRIFIPIFFGTYVSGFLFVFLSSLTEMTVSSVLASPGTETIGMAILDLDEAGNLMEAAVLSLLVIAAMAVFAAVVVGVNKTASHIRVRQKTSRLDTLINSMEGIPWRNQTLQEK
ncbi:iron ABC transporter permease [Alicyclobacillus sp. SO9]|uniref:ABC transporter permease n=1 Tax=Alicyclobacillus sp. SO9 TaxID=2665646 RepID=UPI0018E73D2B|nr:iron ABC transporter permease [Alicyclobacillus sp. SO9]QQE79018.1 iron ABC transporter permease [Alicyclobacillus sp. SO9]